MHLDLPKECNHGHPQSRATHILGAAICSSERSIPLKNSDDWRSPACYETWKHADHENSVTLNPDAFSHRARTCATMGVDLITFHRGSTLLYIICKSPTSATSLLGIPQHKDHRVPSEKHLADESVLIYRFCLLLALSRLRVLCAIMLNKKLMFGIAGGIGKTFTRNTQVQW